MTHWTYTKGLQDLGRGCWAYLQPDGGWGWSNAGLIEDGGSSLLVDTLYDLRLTREMLAAMRASVPAASRIGTLVNSHSNADHTFGNQLVEGAEIIASVQCLEEMRKLSVAERIEHKRHWQELGDLGFFFHESQGPFDFEGIEVTLPTRTFEQALTLHVGSKEVRLIEVGPAHTRGDILVHVPADRTVFTGDILFSNGHPPAWAGPISNWIRACDLIMAMDVDTVVPGHGPIVDKSAMPAFKEYFEYLTTETRRRFDAGMSVTEAAEDIDMRAYDGWGDGERIIVNVNTLYRDFGGKGGLTQNEMRTWMGRYRRERKARAQDHVCGPACSHGH